MSPALPGQLRSRRAAESQTPVIWHFPRVASCLDVARNLAVRGKLDVWESVTAESQEKGRGQLRREWFSPPGNIYAALRLPLSSPFDAAAAAPAVGFLLARALRAAGIDVYIKWPNDLAVAMPGGGEGKIAGILLEEREGILLAGIGVNLAEAPPRGVLREEAALPGVCLGEFFGPDVPVPAPLQLWKRLVKHMCSSYNDNSFHARWISRAEKLLLWRHRDVELVDGARSARGRLEGLGGGGGLLLSRDGACEEMFGGSLRLWQSARRGNNLPRH